MNTAVKLGAGVAGGYLLGRTKKLKLAVGLGAWLIGKRLDLSPSQLALQGLGQLRQSPEFGELSDRVRNEVGGAGKRALAAAATSRVDALADRLHDRNAGVTGSDDEYDEDEYDDEEDDGEPRAEEDEYDDEDEEEDDGEPRAEEDEYDDEGEYEDEGEEEDEDDDQHSRGEETSEDEPYPDERQRGKGRRTVSAGDRRSASNRRR